MNILMLSDVSAYSVIGGAERMMRGQCDGLASMGHNVSLIVREPELDPCPVVEFNGMTEYRYPVDRTSSLGYLTSIYRESIRMFDEVVQSQQPDVIMIHQSLSGIGPIIRRPRACDRWVYICYSLAHEEYLTRNVSGPSLLRTIHARIRRFVERTTIERSDAVVVLSDFMRRRVVEQHHISTEVITLIPGAADTEHFVPGDMQKARKMTGLPPDKTILFTVRNLVPRMGLDNLIEAVHKLNKDTDDVFLVIGGSGPLRTELQNQIEKAGLGERVILKGFIDEKLLPKYYQAADLVVMPTSALEGFGLVTVEALACGTPVLGTPIAATPEILTPIDSCLLADGATPDQLAKAITSVLGVRSRDRDRWEAITRKGRQLAETTYSWDHHCGVLDTLLNSISARN